MEKDKTVAKWTKNHGITIQYVTGAGNVRGYRPDFLVERIDEKKSYTKLKVGGSLIILIPSANTKPLVIGVENGL